MVSTFKDRFACRVVSKDRVDERPASQLGDLRTSIVALLLMSFGMFTQANAKAQAPAAMQTVTGKHIVLKADGGSPESLAEFVAAFDAAVPQWERFWQLPPQSLSDWKVDAFVMDEPQRFRDSGDLPSDLNFPFGYAIPGNLWVIRQKSDYYTRHLLLHEGVHALAIQQFGGTGPAWFAEGTAEMLGVHADSGSDARVNVVPQSRNATPYWGRFKLLSQRRVENRMPTIDSVLEYPRDLKSDVESYGWSWIAVMLFSEYPEYHGEVIRAAKSGNVDRQSFSDDFKRRLRSQWPIIAARWRMLLNTIDYGFDWERERIELSIKDPIWDGRPTKRLIKADQGWQSTGVRFAPGMRLKISATGSCTINDDPKPWVSQPPGVTIHYANERPLGQLLVCILPNKTEEQRHLAPLFVEAVEAETEIVIDKHCWVLFRINDDLGDLGNNRGGYTVSIRR